MTDGPAISATTNAITPCAGAICCATSSSSWTHTTTPGPDACTSYKLLREACREVAKSENKVLSEKAFKAVRKRYRTILTQGGKELPEPPPRTGRRGRIARSDAENLLEALKKYETEVLRFVRNPDVPFTNNRAERDIRMAKVKQKVSGCFRTTKHADAYCRISSYLQSMARQGYNPLTAVQIALKGEAARTLEDPG